MGTNPLIPQGVLNRVRAAVQVSIDSEMNVTAPYLGAEGVSFTPTGKLVTYIRTLTGMVRSPEPYMEMVGSIHLLRTQGLANLYKQAFEQDGFLDQLTVRPDARELGTYVYFNCSITGVETLRFNGTDAGFMVQVGGIYPTNGSLFDNA